MTRPEKVARVAATLREKPDLLDMVAEFLMTDGLEWEDSCDLAETVCTAAFGQRVLCECGSFVLPGFLCWGCEEWTAPDAQERP